MGQNLRRLSPLRYPGGKASLTNLFIDLIRKNKLHGTYVEPYAGGAGAALGLLMSGTVEKIIINDLDPAVKAFWDAVVYDSENFIDRIDATPLTVQEWRGQKERYKRSDVTTIDKGFAFFYLNRTNRSGIINAGPIGGINQNGNYLIDARYNKSDLISKVRNIGALKDRITVRSLDGVELVKSLNANEPMFVYVDPPYYVKGGSLYLNHYMPEDHERLADVLNARQDLSWLLTYDSVEPIRALYSERRMRDFALNYSARNHALGSEVMIFSDVLSLVETSARISTATAPASAQ
jgi:DNA adenine methylase